MPMTQCASCQQYYRDSEEKCPFCGVASSFAPGNSKEDDAEPEPSTIYGPVLFASAERSPRATEPIPAPPPRALSDRERIEVVAVVYGPPPRALVDKERIPREAAMYGPPLSALSAEQKGSRTWLWVGAIVIGMLLTWLLLSL